MPVVPLHANPDLEHLKHIAKTLRDLVRSGADGAIALVREHHPRLGTIDAGSSDATAFRLADAQLVVARHHGFPSWTQLRRHVELVTSLARNPHAQPVDLAPDEVRGDGFVRLACLTYGADDDGRLERAHRLLGERPDLAHASIYTMAAVGDHATLRAELARDPSLANIEGGPFGWPPLLYLAYSRVDSADPAHDSLAAAQVLLAAGADPDAGYLWEGLVPPFTALTGAFGGGEGGQPPHPHELALARLLLEAGADANDGQTIYNRSLGGAPRDDVEWLALLLDHGLGEGDGGAWYVRLGPVLASPRELVAEVLQHAAEWGLRDRVRLLLDRGADPRVRARHPIFEGRSAIEGATKGGRTEIVAWLEQAMR